MQSQALEYRFGEAIEIRWSHIGDDEVGQRFLRLDMQGVHWFYNGVELMFHGLRGPPALGHIALEAALEADRSGRGHIDYEIEHACQRL